MESKISNQFDLNNFDKNDVVSLNSQLFKVSQLKEAIRQSFSDHIGHQLHQALSQRKVPINTQKFSGHYQDQFDEWWFVSYGSCEVLRPGNKGWQKGKIRMKIRVDLEFCPDETEDTNSSGTESPLDDIRQLMNE